MTKTMPQTREKNKNNKKNKGTIEHPWPF